MPKSCSSNRARKPSSSCRRCSVTTTTKTTPSREPRAPIVTVMGHVDHGKTTLLDAIRHANVVAGEAGGITQHIGAYQTVYNGHPITFIDTPGHEAFTAMRARGAKCNRHRRARRGRRRRHHAADRRSHRSRAVRPKCRSSSGSPRSICDAPIPTWVRQQLVEARGLVPEPWGGDTIVVDVAPPAGTGVDELLEALVLVAEVEELTANPKVLARAIVLESNLDSGRGPVVTALVDRGTLRVGDPIVAGGAWGRVRAMFDENGQQVSEAGPSVPVEVLGLDDVPLAGDELRVAPDDKTARTVAEARLLSAVGPRAWKHPMSLAGGARLEDIFAMVQRGEALSLRSTSCSRRMSRAHSRRSPTCWRKLDQTHEEVRLSFVHRAVGGINESDVNLAAVSNATVIGFNSGTLPRLGQPRRRGARRRRQLHRPRLGTHRLASRPADACRPASAARSSSCSATTKTRVTRSSTRPGRRRSTSAGSGPSSTASCEPAEVEEAFSGADELLERPAGPLPGQHARHPHRSHGQHLERLPVHGDLQHVAFGFLLRVGHRPRHGLPRFEPGPARLRPHDAGRGRASASWTWPRRSCRPAAPTTSTSR